MCTFRHGTQVSGVIVRVVQEQRNVPILPCDPSITGLGEKSSTIISAVTLNLDLSVLGGAMFLA